MVDQYSDVREIMIALLVFELQYFKSRFRFFLQHPVFRLKIPPIPLNLPTSIRSWQLPMFPPKYPRCKIPQVK